jgi:flagellar motor switch protein FliG
LGLFTTKSSRVALGEFFGEELMNTEISDIASTEEDLDPEEKIEFLEHISLEHDRFKNLMAIKNGQRFSILSLMNEKELEYVFSNESTKDVSYLLHFLPRESISTVLNKMDNDQKSEIILNLKKSSNFTNYEEKEIEERLNKKINTFASSAFSTFMSEDSLVGSILDESDDVQEILSKISDTDESIAKNFKEHSLNFDYFIKNKLKDLAKLFENIPNDILSVALIDLKKDQCNNVLNALSPTRKKVIASSMLMKSKSTEEEIKKSKLQAGKLARKAFQLLKRNKVSKAS